MSARRGLGAPERVVSGGQTGVDRAALDAALEAGIPCGGVAPKGRRAEDGRIPARYPVEECDSPDYARRTELNVLRADATLILNRGELSGGTLATAGSCRGHGRPCCVVQLDEMTPEEAAARVRSFLSRAAPRVLNVAGPRESKSPGIYQAGLEVLRLVLKDMGRPGAGGPDA